MYEEQKGIPAMVCRPEGGKKDYVYVYVHIGDPSPGAADPHVICNLEQHEGEGGRSHGKSACADIGEDRPDCRRLH